ncbi:Lysophospholipid acyltransferase family protein [Sulfidibacter corallicola]|uniref:Lysophospholipid acyltransferase family protein n=1 Tax=Sulfidibacter corallicola TaxID=2818388 RepID=A0A8A4TIS8_SULCO|nr:lysophospholipid acyltransferase family protein [Sulfidibacter corallicola]QTD49826.1 lysophospholipid acyltransferase family protein [Sulfidibacter corallicola]
MTSKPKTEQVETRESLKTVIIGLILSVVLRLIYASCRKRFVNPEHLTRYLDGDQPALIAAWHNRNLMAAFAYLAHRRKGRQIVPLASASRDGGMATWAMRGLGIRCARGSSSRGGFAALKTLMRELKAGNDVAITPDGPRGPVYSIQGGVITAAKMTQAPIVPFSWQASKRKELGSWDRMIVPRPFSTLVFVYGEPLEVPRNCPAVEIENYAEELRRRMLALNDQAEAALSGS